MTLRVLDLFSGIGGFSLGLERTGGFETVAFCEIDPFCRRVLAKHWPHVKQYEDIRNLTADQLRTDGIAVDVICGGFPCQDISIAGLGAGLDGARSGLWAEYARLVGELRPSFVLVENVSALLGRGLDRVLGDLASLGYDAEWHCIPASAVGAPHRRDRVWIVAYAKCGEGGERYDAAEERRRPYKAEQAWLGSVYLADARRFYGKGEFPSLPSAQERTITGERPFGPFGDGIGWWASEPNVGRVAHGVPSRVDRLKALGNAVVPQIPELIGNAILESMRESA